MLALLAQEGSLTHSTRLRLFGSVARPVQVADRVFAIEPLSNAAPLVGSAWLVLHFAFLGKERTSDLGHAAFLAGNDKILSDTLRIALGACDLRFVFTSSGAAHTPDRESNLYGWCKAAHETRIADWCGEHAVPLLMPRIFNIGGPFANKLESYALSSMILSALHTGRITIRAQRPTFRSYVHVNELLTTLCDAALAQKAGAPKIFDTVGQDIIEMAGLAAAVAASSVSRDVRVNRVPMIGTAPDRYVGDAVAWRLLLATQDRTPVPLDIIVADTIADLRKRATGIGEELMRA